MHASPLALPVPSPASPPASACLHCGTGFPGSGPFCCTGCETVFGLLQEGGLGAYYDLKRGSYAFQPASPVAEAAESYAYLDSPDLRPLYLDPSHELRIFVEGIHCAACLWLLERLPRLSSAVAACRLDLAQSLLTVRVAPGAELGGIPALVQRLGYRPHPIRADQGVEELQRREQREALLRLGLAGGCAGNIMLMAVPLYGGAAGPLATLMRGVSAALFVPVATYCALPFYRSALGALRARQINIDVPIALALALGAVASFANLATGSPHLYFDSLAALVFLLLASRYALRQFQARAAQSSRLVQQFFAPVARRRAGGTVESLSPERLQAGDEVLVGPGERLPADGRLRGPETHINAAWLTGEALPVPVREGEPVYAGTLNAGPEIAVEVTQPLSGSRLGAILSQLEREPRAPLIGLTDRVARHFLVGVVALAAGVVLWFLPTSPVEGFQRALSLLIVTCPCALALATPLTFAASLGRALRRGYVVKQGETLERLAQVRRVAFDKTGTLTHGELEVAAWESATGDPARQRAVVLALERASLHPIARALRHHLRGTTPAELADVEERTGSGVSGIAPEGRFELRALADEDPTATCVGLWRGDGLQARIRLRDRVRAEAAGVVAELRALGLEASLLSGDGEAVVGRLGQELGLGPEACRARLDPEAKHRAVAAAPHTLMVGDGANDALALQYAHVGVAMHGGMDLSLRVADVYLAQPRLAAIPDLVVLGRETERVLRRNFALSIGFNLAGGVAALGGWIHPLAAAVLMPLSSVTVLLSSTFGTRAMRRRFGGGQ